MEKGFRKIGTSMAPDFPGFISNINDFIMHMHLSMGEGWNFIMHIHRAGAISPCMHGRERQYESLFSLSWMRLTTQRRFHVWCGCLMRMDGQ